MAKGKEMTTTKSLSGQICFGTSDNFNIKNNIRLTTLFLLLLIGNFHRFL